MKTLKGGQRKTVANELGKNLKHFVNSEIGSVPWWLDYVKVLGNERRQVKFRH